MDPSDFDGKMFAIGTVTGMRAFAVNGTRLTSPVRDWIHWVPGENRGVCPYHGYERVAVQRCSCGFYAYYDGSNEYLKGFRVAAIVEGYGRVTYGPKGFRSEKAKIVALIRHGKAGPIPKPARTMIWVLRVYILLWVAFSMILLYKRLPSPSAFINLIPVVVAFSVLGVFSGLYGGFFYMFRLRKIARYYGVPLYRTQRKALKHHPLSAPAELP